MGLQTYLNAVLPHPKATLEQLVKEAQRDFVRLPAGALWRHPVYGYVARSDGKSFWAFSSTQAPLPSSVLRTPSGKRRLFHSADKAITALVRLHLGRIR